MNIIENENFFLKEKNKKLEQENAKLKKELEDLEFRFECFKKSPPYKAVELAQKGMDELKEENARLREVNKKALMEFESLLNAQLTNEQYENAVNIILKALQGKEE